MSGHLMQPRYLATVEDVGATMTVHEQRERRRPVKNPAAGLPIVLSRVGIALDKHPLEGTPYHYQVGISLQAMNPYFVEWRGRCPDMEPTDGKVSGVVLFDDDTVIGHYTSKLNHHRPNWQMAVHADYRNKGLMTLAVLEWFKAAPFVALAPRTIVGFGKRAALTAHRNYLLWAIRQGHPVPQNVVDSLGG